MGSLEEERSLLEDGHLQVLELNGFDGSGLVLVCKQRVEAVDCTLEMALLTFAGCLFSKRILAIGRPAHLFWVLNAVSVWPIMGLPLILKMLIETTTQPFDVAAHPHSRAPHPYPPTPLRAVIVAGKHFSESVVLNIAEFIANMSSGLLSLLVFTLNCIRHSGILNILKLAEGMPALTLSASVPTLEPAECVGSVCPPATAAHFLVWIQENVGWGLGLGILALFMGMASAIFFSGTPLYRFQRPGGNPVTRMCHVFGASFHIWNLKVATDSNLLYETDDKHSAIEGSQKLEHSKEFNFFPIAASDAIICQTIGCVLIKLLYSKLQSLKSGDFLDQWRLCIVMQVGELKILIRMFPIWAAGIVFSAALMPTLFTEQGMMMDTSIGSFTIPPASLSTSDVISIIFWVRIHDGVIVPIARKFTGKERGLSEYVWELASLFPRDVSCCSGRDSEIAAC
ncbi:hypothetical protein SLEP1_g24383 [Rubroshorea leprosula]|uniref:Uncharacterized protein n=1 Tax=Rubroshorea leprosula TaxID=152421 RepID=A0AAV5JFK0_9ROSI|nr:hypothetical protein SLEP1_g24383 [Rubroshorea leprosula]